MITINGKTYPGNNLSIHGNVVYIDGKKVDGDPNEKGILQVEITGDPVNVSSDCSVNVSGNVLGNVKASGSVKCGDVGGQVNASGSADCGNIGGDLVTGGSAKCESVVGNVKAGGSVTYRK